jgi:small subunit ribosomal protein S20
MAQGTATKVKKRKKSVLKRARKSAQLSDVNRGHRTRVRSVIRSMRSALSSGDPAAAKTLLSPTLAALDRAVAKGVLNRNAANRYKSRLTLACNTLSAAKKAS